MKEGMDPTQQGRTYRWRPAVAPYRPRSASRRRPHKPVPGQMSLPGLELPLARVSVPTAGRAAGLVLTGPDRVDSSTGLAARCWTPLNSLPNSLPEASIELDLLLARYSSELSFMPL